MKIEVRVFAGARELAGQATVTVEVGPRATVGDLRRVLSAAYPALAALIAKSAIAVDQELAGNDACVDPGQEIALLPPVSGGAS